MNRESKLLVLIVFLGLSSLRMFGQEAQLISGKVKVDESVKEPVHIYNLNNESGTLTDDGYEFSLKAEVGDSLVFSSVQLETKILVVSEKDLDSSDLVVPMDFSVNELEEVFIREYKLTGNLIEDLKIVTEPNYIENLPIFNYNQIKGMNLIFQEDAQSNVKNNALTSPLVATPIDLKQLFKKASRLMNDSEIQIAKKQLNDIYKENYLREHLNLPTEEFYNFMDYLEEQNDFQYVLQSKNPLDVLEYILAKVELYKSTYDIKG